MPRLPPNQTMWVCYMNEIDSVTIVERGAGSHVFKRGSKPKDPYVVTDGTDHFVIGSADLYDSPRDASIAAAKLAKEHGYEPNPPNTSSDEDELAENPIEEEDESEEDSSEEEEDSEETEE